MGKRRSSRELALKFLYQTEFNDEEFQVQLEEYADGLSCKEEVKGFMKEMVENIRNHSKEIDGLVNKYSQHWALDRMTLIDRNILRMGVCELMFLSGIPPKVAINEAVEIAKKYGNEESPDFINGILDRIFKEVVSNRAQPSLG